MRLFGGNVHLLRESFRFRVQSSRENLQFQYSISSQPALTCVS